MGIEEQRSLKGLKLPERGEVDKAKDVEALNMDESVKDLATATGRRCSFKPIVH